MHLDLEECEAGLTCRRSCWRWPDWHDAAAAADEPGKRTELELCWTALARHVLRMKIWSRRNFTVCICRIYDNL